MKSSKMKWLGMAVILMTAGWGSASAADVYELNPITVTAQRTESRDLKTPAAVEVLTADDIRKSGAVSVQQALQYSTGIIMHAQGPRNIAFGSMTDKAVIRGNEKGTLVLIDGVPVNQNGKYNLEDIPTDSIEKIEVVRGGGAVLYGSEASGGVINVITKGTRDNSVKAALGNYGIQNYSVSAQAGKLGITYTYDHTGRIDKISSPSLLTKRGIPGLYYNVRRGEQSNVDARYNFTDDLYLTTSFGKDRAHYIQKFNGTGYAANKGKETKGYIYEWQKSMNQLHYNHNNLKSYVFYNTSQMRSNSWSIPATKANFDANGKRTYSNTLTRDQSYGMDISNRWDESWGSFMIGYDFQRDLENVRKAATYTGKGANRKLKDSGIHNYARNMHSIYGQLSYDFTSRDTADFNFRETWVESDSAGNKYDKFTPEVTYTHSFNDTTSMYAKVGKSFMMPTFSQLYDNGNIVGNPGLKPETGKHYELGFKKDIGRSAWRAAIFHYSVKDSIDADLTNYPTITYTNTDIRNTGIEVDWSRRQSENLSYHFGVTYSHPEKKTEDENNGNWHDYYGRFQFNTGLSYVHGKLTSSFEMNVLSHRKRDAEPYESFKSQCFTDLNFSYQANKDARFFLNIDNLFNRHDIVSSSSSNFYNLGRNFLAGVEYKF